MNVLHILPKDSRLIQQHVQMLVDGLRQSANVMVADNNKSFYQQATDMQADIVHIHGVCHPVNAKAFRFVKKSGLRYVISLHGNLEPWNLKGSERFAMVYSRKEYLEKAYAIITMGKMERNSFQMLGWNKRIEEVHNAVYTNTLSQAEMASQTFAIYQKVMDSNTLELMDEYTTKALAAILKAGIMGDKRWIEEGSFDSRLINWRQLLVYAEHENIVNYTDYGIRILGLSAPLIDTTKIAAYFPKNYTRPKTIKELAGDYQGDQTDFLLRMIRQIQKAPTLLNLIEMTRELYRENVNDEQLIEKLEEEELETSTARLLQLLSEQVLLDEGYMPIAPINDKQTAKLRSHLKNHLKI